MSIKKIVLIISFIIFTLISSILDEPCPSKEYSEQYNEEKPEEEQYKESDTECLTQETETFGQPQILTGGIRTS